jgi:threonine/homoserine/homoserine lactone efflux protein
MPKVKIFMGILGAGYMVYLAIKIMRTKEEDKREDQEDNDDSSKTETLEKSENLNSFLTGMTMQFVNPKAILYGITVISNFIIPYYKSSVVLLLFSIFLAFVGLMSTASWALFGSLFKRFLSKYSKAFNISMGLLLIYSALSISGISQLFH